MSAVVVDLPLVPVMAMSGQLAPDIVRCRQNNSMSPMISTPALWASAADQCGVGCVSGTPGVSTRAATFDQSSSRKFCVLTPAACASATFFSSSSKAITSAPPASSARADNRPELPRPKSATFWPENTVTGIIAQLQRRQPRERQHHGDDPEPDHDLRLGPAELLVVMVDRRHPEYAFPVSLNETTCTITDTASSTNSPPTMASTISCLMATATVPSRPPSASEPVSPMKIDAGGALNQRNPRPAPITAPHSTASSPVPATYWI